MGGRCGGQVVSISSLHFKQTSQQVSQLGRKGTYYGSQPPAAASRALLQWREGMSNVDSALCVYESERVHAAGVCLPEIGNRVYDC